MIDGITSRDFTWEGEDLPSTSCPLPQAGVVSGIMSYELEPVRATTGRHLASVLVSLPIPVTA